MLVQSCHSGSPLLSLGVKIPQTSSSCLETSMCLEAMNWEVGFSVERTPKAASSGPYFGIMEGA